jgi:protoporphyrinogen oxidase
MAKNFETIIIGGGISGLAAAVTLQKHNKDFLLIEKSDQVGGRIKTDRVKGFQFDHGFQVLNPGYRQAKALLNLKDLKLNYFDAGIAIRDGDTLRTVRDPFRHPSKLFNTLSNLPGSFAEKKAFVSYVTKLILTPQASRLKFADISAKAALVEAGVDEVFLQKVIKPFLSGVFLESELATSRIFLDEVLVSFFAGTPALPQSGMAAIGEQLASKLPAESIALNEQVLKIEPGIIITNKNYYQVKNLILATDVQVATRLLNLPDVKVHKVKTWYLLANQNKEEILSGQKLILTDSDTNALLVNSVVISQIAPSYAPPDTSLISASAIAANTKVESKVLLDYLSKLYQLPTNKWQIVAEYEILNALPAMYPPFTPIKNSLVADGLFVAGDHRNFSSIQGALDAGVRAAKASIS